MLYLDGAIREFGIDGILSSANLTLWAMSNPVRCARRGSSRLILNKSSHVPLVEWNPSEHQPISSDGSVGTLLSPIDYSTLTIDQRDSFYRAAWQRMLLAIGAETGLGDLPRRLFDPVSMPVPLKNIANRYKISAIGHLDAKGSASISFYMQNRPTLLFKQAMGPTLSDWLGFGRLLRVRDGMVMLDVPHMEPVHLFEI
ncbi:hypothetical protein [Yimella sp. cx-51]|uniref:hypothetical protein n=1 Tax=Yimella sp. cx-51 TaxID=2770551 RepID=UPI00165D81E2|nr:hypothetical protein [Yimella sp. cx-51]MBC9957309.1 hypothetical protein [Yimella sp. cx-51]QTH36825.1 hypothetical protein J5M86_07610 [Yimella sp. cx-51]